MRAAEHTDQGPGTNALTHPIARVRPTPVYAKRALARRPSARSTDGSLRGWPAQLAQWALVFGVLGLIIGGAKWWDRQQNATQSPTPTVAAVELDAG